jgi:hypothetical protein
VVLLSPTETLLARLARFTEFVESKAPGVLVDQERSLVQEIVTQLSVEELLEVIERFPRFRAMHKRGFLQRKDRGRRGQKI